MNLLVVDVLLPSGIKEYASTCSLQLKSIGRKLLKRFSSSFHQSANMIYLLVPYTKRIIPFLYHKE